MNVLWIWEGDNTTTRVTIPVEQVARDMERYFRHELGLRTELDINVQGNIMITIHEAMRAERYKNEWRDNENLWRSSRRLTLVKR